MGAVVAVFLRGLIAVIGMSVLVAVVWTGYVKREALASALEPASEIVKRLRGISAAADPSGQAPASEATAPTSETAPTSISTRAM